MKRTDIWKITGIVLTVGGLLWKAAVFTTRVESDLEQLKALKPALDSVKIELRAMQYKDRGEMLNRKQDSAMRSR